MPQHIVQQGNEISGWPVPLSETDRESYERSKSKPDYGVDPIMMGLLSAGASLMRNSGWRNTPITSEEQWGHAIPAGMNAYLQQRRANMDEEQVAYSRQLQENQARQAQIEKAQKDQALREQAELEQRQLNEFKNRVKNDPDFKTGPQQRSKGNILAMADRDFKKAIDMYEAKKLGALKAGRRLTPEEVQEFEAQGYKGAYQIKTDSEGIQTVFDVAGSVVKKAEADKPGEHSMSGRALMKQFPERYGGILQDTGMYKVGPGMLKGSIDVLSEIAIAGAEEEEETGFTIEEIPELPGKLSVTNNKTGTSQLVPKPGPTVTDEDVNALATTLRTHAKTTSDTTLETQVTGILAGKMTPALKQEALLKELADLEQRKVEKSKEDLKGQWYRSKDEEAMGGVKGTFKPSIVKEAERKGLDLNAIDADEITYKEGNFEWVDQMGKKSQLYWSGADLKKHRPGLAPKDALSPIIDNFVYRLVVDAQGYEKPEVVRPDKGATYKTVVINPENNAIEERIHQWLPNGELSKEFQLVGDTGFHKGNLRIIERYDAKTGFTHMIELDYEKTDSNGRPTENDLGYSKERYRFVNLNTQAVADAERRRQLKLDLPKLLIKLRDVYKKDAKDIDAIEELSKSNMTKAWSDAVALIREDAPFQYYGHLATGQELMDNPIGLDGKQKYENIRKGIKFNPVAMYRLTKEGEWLLATGDDQTIHFGREDTLRREYNLVTKDVQTAATAYNALLAGVAVDNGAGDIMIITSFRRMFEPDSVVREGEFAITEESQGMIDYIRNLPTKFREGERLHKDARAKFVETARAYMAGLKNYFKEQRSRYVNIAISRGIDEKSLADLIPDPLLGLPLTGDVMEYTERIVEDEEGKKIIHVEGKRVPDTSIRNKDVSPVNLINQYFSGLNIPSGTVSATSLRGAPE